MNTPIKVLSLFAGIGISVLSTHNAFSQPEPSAERALPSASADHWRHAMVKTPLPGKGCFTTSYPDTEWHRVQCATAPPRQPTPPRIRSPGTDAPMSVGDGTDFFARVASGTSISQGEGAFTKVSGVTGESDGGVANEFGLQLNSNPFTTAACNGVSGCMGWAQFIYGNPYQSLTGPKTYGAAYIQYWLVPTTGGSLTCPSGPWQSSNGGCFYNSPAVCVPSCSATTDLTIASLPFMTLTGTPGAGGNDTVVFGVSGTLYSTCNDCGTTNVNIGLSGNWTTTEFNIFGDGGGSTAMFNSGATVGVITRVNNGTTNAPSCTQTKPSVFTGETNSLTLVSPCCPFGGASPGIIFEESSASGATTTCSLLRNTWLPAVAALLLDH
jgi:hypothetical protein